MLAQSSDDVYKWMQLELERIRIHESGGHTMEKIGEVRSDITPCDVCGSPSTHIVGKSARCSAHKTSTKAAEVDHGVAHLKSFTEPLEEG